MKTNNLLQLRVVLTDKLQEWAMSEHLAEIIIDTFLAFMTALEYSKDDQLKVLDDTKNYFVDGYIRNQLVISEATKLKANATKIEIDKLDFDWLSSKSTTSCVYGQMTGYCFNTRATKLIKLSCQKVFTAKHNRDVMEGTINGSPAKMKRDTFWSPIEIFIDQPKNKTNGNNKRLVQYIKGGDDKLTLK